jgi:serine protease DegS/serine protease DegQ
MQRLWLVFTQAVTISIAALFVVDTLKPEWLGNLNHPSATYIPTQTVLNIVDPLTARSATAAGSYASAVQRSLPSVVHVFTSKDTSTPSNPLSDDPLFRHFFGNRNRQNTPSQTPQAGLGSGVIVSSDGLILTNNHVIEGADEIEILINDGRRLPAILIGNDPESDLAVLRAETRESLPAITFSNDQTLQVGDVVLAIGNPFGVGQTVTMGIVSALGRSHLGINTFENYIQTDAAINPGNSGGALVDTAGNLVGINTAIYSRSGGSLGIGFAIPASLARSVLEQIIATGSVIRGWVGVEIQELTPDLASSFGYQNVKGTLIAGVLPNGPADRAGIHPGDILIGINDTPLPGPKEMLDTVASIPPGEQAQFQILRRGKMLNLAIEIGRRPVPATVQR